MRITIRLAAVCFALLWCGAVPAAAQASSVQLSDFAGTWKAEFHKQIWLVLTLTPASGSLTGTLAHSIQVSADDKGEITSVGDEMSTGAISSVKLQGATLHFTAQDEEGGSEEYSLVLTAPGSADLQPVTSSPTGAPKPFHLKRAPSAQK